MKKLFCLALLASLGFGISIDENSAKAVIEAYKTPDKMSVGVRFSAINFSFAKNEGSVADILTNTSANIDLESVETDNPMRDRNLREKLFAKLSSFKASAVILSVNGDEQKGELSAKITLNEVEKEVAMSYEIKDNKLSAFGEIDLEKDFDALSAFDNFRNDKIIQGLHMRKTWPSVKIGFEVGVK